MGFMRVYGPIAIAMLIAVVGMGSLAGANMAINETEGQDELANATAELQTIPTDIERDLEQNMTGIGQTVTKRMMMPLVDVGVGASVMSVQFGYNHPFLGKWIGRLAPVGMIGATLAYIWGLWKRMKHYQQ